MGVDSFLVELGRGCWILGIDDWLTSRLEGVMIGKCLEIGYRNLMFSRLCQIMAGIETRGTVSEMIYPSLGKMVKHNGEILGILTLLGLVNPT